MLKKSLLLLPLIAALSAVSLPAQGADYHVVVPVPGKVAPYAAIKLELSSGSLPVGVLGDPYVGFDFNTALRITGDPELDMSQVSWLRYSGELPDGLTLTRDGRIYGTPVQTGSTSFQALAKYKTKTALGTYTAQVNDIVVTVSGELPQIAQREPVNFPLTSLLSVSGDPAYQDGQESWSIISGELPEGLALSASGMISGQTDIYGRIPLTMQAVYKGRTVSQELVLNVEKRELGIVSATGYRTWEDGSVAASCQDYKNSVWPNVYKGDVGNELYRIQPEGSIAFDARCDMTSGGGGWTLIISQNELTPVTWTGAQSGTSFSLHSGQIPAHTQVAFGRTDMPILDYVTMTYSTGNIARTLVSSPVSGNSYMVHRDVAGNYATHAPDKNYYDTDSIFGMKNTLTFDLNDGTESLTWAFSPFATESFYRGYSFNGGYYRSEHNTEDWLVWVR